MSSSRARCLAERKHQEEERVSPLSRSGLGLFMSSLRIRTMRELRLSKSGDGTGTASRMTCRGWPSPRAALWHSRGPGEVGPRAGGGRRRAPRPPDRPAAAAAPGSGREDPGTGDRPLLPAARLGSAGSSAGAMAQTPVTFDDIAVYFSEEEWEELAQWQKELYQDVMRDNYEALVALGHVATRPDIVLLIEHGEKPCVKGPEDSGKRGIFNNDYFYAEITRKETYPGESLSGQEMPRLLAVEPRACTFQSSDRGLVCGAHFYTENQQGNLTESRRHVPVTPWENEFTEACWFHSTIEGGQAASCILFQGPPCAPECKICPLDVLFPQLLSSTDTLYKCTQSERWFTPQLAPGSHCSASIGVDPSRYTECVCSTNNNFSLIAHSRTCSKQPPSKCTSCEQSSALATPPRTQPEGWLYRCIECEKRFHCKQKYAWHQRAHAGERPYRCSRCGKSFRYKHEFSWHLRVHMAERPYKCDGCEKSFRYKQEFAWHQRTHMGDRPYQCTMCGKHFQYKQEFTWHQKSHRGEKSYKCVGCGKSFRYKQEFIWHQRIHSGGKPYQCPMCERTFSCKQQYACHQQVHAGEKPHKCSECARSFSRSSALLKHRKLHMGERSYCCPGCDKSFSQHSNLAKHQRMRMWQWGPLEGQKELQDARKTRHQKDPVTRKSL
ncbi:zinc finger protein 23 isoform X2 [Alligator mississippiensis]|uniref:zinc finger protein 23 isoform X2 n=1 Tax=Alligator mississippiensis TaxID=8496 RepID=UPI002877FA98|nr:zinc finger protein 23 isoform X2 [Alligator mississippiensis]